MRGTCLETEATPDPPNHLLVRNPEMTPRGYAIEMLEETTHRKKQAS